MDEIRAYVAHFPRLSCASFVRKFTQDSGTWKRWEEGGQVFLDTADRIRAYMAANPPPSPEENPPFTGAVFVELEPGETPDAE